MKRAKLLTSFSCFATTAFTLQGISLRVRETANSSQQWNVFKVLFRCEKRRPTRWFGNFLTFSHMISVFFQPNWLYLGLKTQLVWKKTEFMWEKVKKLQNHLVARCFHKRNKTLQNIPLCSYLWGGDEIYLTYLPIVSRFFYFFTATAAVALYSSTTQLSLRLQKGTLSPIFSRILWKLTQLFL